MFGASFFPCIRPYQNHKFEFHSIKCVNLGYSEVHKGYKCLSPHGRIYITRHIVFNENEFPFATGFLNTRQPEQFVTMNTPHSWFTLPTVSPYSESPHSVPESSVSAAPSPTSSHIQGNTDSHSYTGSPIPFMDTNLEDCQDFSSSSSQV